MDWTALIMSQGIPVAFKVWEIWSNGNAPTTADWQELLALGRVQARSNMLASLARNGVDPNSPQGQALLALTPA